MSALNRPPRQNKPLGGAYYIIIGFAWVLMVYDAIGLGVSLASSSVGGSMFYLILLAVVYSTYRRLRTYAKLYQKGQ